MGIPGTDNAYSEPAFSDGGVPVPEDYEAVRSFLSSNREAVDFAIQAVMQMAGASCPKSTLAAIVDHLKESQGELPLVEPSISLEKEPAPFY